MNDMKDIKNTFLHPSNEFRAKPFWAWNGKLENDELKRQIDVIKAMGFGGYFMHSRIGLITEYLGEEWFEHINFCADYGDSIGLESWIYDEDRWPSGSAGGIATANRQNRMKFLRMNIGQADKNTDAVAVFSCRIDRENVYDVHRMNENDPSGGDMWFDIIEFPESPNYNGAAYLDTMKLSATEEYITSTHKKYADKCDGRLGTSIKGVFTDEPHRGHLLLDMSLDGVDISGCVPYTDTLFEDFEKHWGYDLRDRLPSLFLCENGEKVSQVKWHYCETVQRLFLENFIRPISDWCSKHNMIYTGHMLHEDTLSAQTIMNGSLMRCYELMDYPGVDVLGSKNNHYNIVKQLSSVANQCGKQWLLSELYGCTGWQMTLEDYKRIGDWQALMGINLRCPHLSWYTMEGECKRDYPASIFYQSAWYKEYSHLEDYFARLGVFMAQGKPECDLLVINPVESMWCRFKKGWAKWLNTADELCLETEKQFEDMYKYLLSHNVEFDYGDEDMLARLAKISGGCIKVGQASYKQVIVSGMVTIRSTTLKLLKDFEKSGGQVIVCGDLPEYVDALPQRVEIGNADIEAVLAKRLITADDPAVFTSVRKSADGKYYVMLLNTDEKNEVETKLTLPDGYIERWCPETGETAWVDRTEKITLCPGEMRLIVISDCGHEAATEKPLPCVQLGEISEYRTDEPNVLVIDSVKCTVGTEQITGDVLKTDRVLRKMAGLIYRGGEMYQPWFIAGKDKKEYFELSLQYDFESEIECEAYIASEYRGSICVNGITAQPTDEWWVDPCFKKRKISIRKGTNSVLIKEIFTESSNIEAVYILGEFGVYNGIIKEKPKAIGFGDITKQGFQFYGGKMTYIFDQIVKEKSLVTLKNMCGAAAVNVNGKTIAWSPYTVEVEPCSSIEVQLALTRRNTFGPLHQLPPVTDSYGPDSFLSEGSSWSDNFAVLPCGLEK